MAQIEHTGKIGLVRHGETRANIDKVWHGRTDTELTALGHQQAKQLGAYFHRYMRPDVIYSSPLQRAKITAQAIAWEFNLPINYDERLMEFDLGDWEGRTYETLSQESNVFEQLVNNPEFKAPNGESQTIVKERATEAIEEIVQRHNDKNILIVAHGVTLGIVLAHYLEADTRLWVQYTKDNTSFSELCLNTKTLKSFNQTDHLNR